MRTIRQGSSVRTGWILIGVCALLAFLFALRAGGFELESFQWLAAVALVIWALMIRPSLVLSSDGVGLRNMVRDVDISWPVIDLVESRWNIKIFDIEGHSWGSWAITAQRPSGRGMRSGISGAGGLFPARMSARAPDQTETRLRNPPASAAAVAETIREAQEDYARALRQGAMPPLEARVAVRPAWPSVAALGVAALLVVVAIATT